jgi:hypothetical protein
VQYIAHRCRRVQRKPHVQAHSETFAYCPSNGFGDLSQSLPAFPNGGDDPPFGCRLVRKNSLISVLDELGEKKK